MSQTSPPRSLKLLRNRSNSKASPSSSDEAQADGVLAGLHQAQASLKSAYSALWMAFLPACRQLANRRLNHQHAQVDEAVGLSMEWSWQRLPFVNFTVAGKLKYWLLRAVRFKCMEVLVKAHKEPAYETPSLPSVPSFERAMASKELTQKAYATLRPVQQLLVGLHVGLYLGEVPPLVHELKDDAALCKALNTPEDCQKLTHILANPALTQSCWQKLENRRLKGKLWTVESMRMARSRALAELRTYLIEAGGLP